MGNDRRGHILRDYGPAILFALLIFVVSSLPGPRIPDFHFNPGDKIAHFFEFGIFGILLYRAFKSAAQVHYPFLATIITGFAYGAFDEIHQAFVPGRHSDVTDFAADAAGIIVFGGLSLVLERLGKRSAK